MLTIKLRRSEDEVCSGCNDGGVTLPKMRKLLTDAGIFCDCKVGAEKWEATKQTVLGVEKALAAMPTVPPPPLSLPSPRRFYWGAEPTV
ncbi:MAG: hypothetical protein ACREDR_35055 [Blastocatellia bacterium]